MRGKKNKVKETVSNQVDVKECIESPLNETEVRKQNKRTFKQNAFNVNKVRSLLNETYAHISNMFDILNLNRDSFLSGSSANMNVMKNGSKDDAAVSVGASNHLVLTGKSDSKAVKIRTASAGGNITKISWPKTLEGLVEARKLFKGKKLTYHEKLLKKNLKSRVTKKRKRMEFQMKLEDKKDKEEGFVVEELLKNKKIKPVYNSEGKVIHSKYDFSEIGAKKDICQKIVKDSNKSSLSNTVSEHEPKNGENVDPDAENDTESISKNSKHSAKQKEIRKKKKKSKLIENNSVTYENEQEPLNKKLKLIYEKSNSMHNENESENNTVVSTKNKAVFNKDNKMVFSKIDFSDTNIKRNLKKKEHRDPKKLLQKLEIKKAKIDELKSLDKNKAMDLIEKEKWKIALRKASGEKIKDDAQLLKKTVMKEKGRKKTSRKKWDARIDFVKKMQQERQKKRMENIMAKKKEKKKKKQKKAIKQGRYFPM